MYRLSSAGNRKVCIVGGGVSGLTCAAHIKESRRNVDVTVVHDVPLNETTSFGPPGIFRPSLQGPRRILKDWAKTSFRKFEQIAQSADANVCGVQMVSGFQLSDDLSWLKDQEDYYSHIVHNFRWLPESDLDIFNVKFKHGIFYTTYTAEGHLYTPWLLEKVKSSGTSFFQKKVEKLDELSKDFDVVINCSGLRAKDLVDDAHIRPQRGVLLRVHAPWIKHFVYAGNDATFICPGRDSVYIGTVRQMDASHLIVEQKDKEDILKRCTEIMPSIKNATVINEWAGLRPYRLNPRVERQIMDSSSGKFNVIHNYGHGGNGFVMSWGCAEQVADMMDTVLRDKSKL